MISKKLNQVYKLYDEGKYKEAQKLNGEILSTNPDNIYAKRYASLLSSLIEPESKKEIPKIKGKQLKCPHCLSRISSTGLTENQRTKIKLGEYNNLDIKCPYCHTHFVLQDKKVDSIIGIKIGDLTKINGINYRVTGYVEYIGYWYEGSYRGRLWYLEWILLGENNSYVYFSEGYSVDEGKRKYEFSLSEKYIPKGKINTRNYNEKYIVNIKSIYGENSKSYIIGEEVELLDFGEYVLELEGSGSQMEAGFYKQISLGSRQAHNLFGKEYSNDVYDKTLLGQVSNSLGIPLPSQKDRKDFSNKLVLFLFVGFIIGFLSYSFFASNIKTLNINDNEIEIGEKYNIIFKNEDKDKEKVVRTRRYDYGGTRTYYEQIEGIKFLIETDKDIELFNKIRDISDIDYNDKSIGTKIKKGNLYKIN